MWSAGLTGGQYEVFRDEISALKSQIHLGIYSLTKEVVLQSTIKGSRSPGMLSKYLASTPGIAA